MKKLFTLVAMAFMAIGANAQAIVAEVDWTTMDAYYGDVWYASPSEVSVNSTDGLVINCLQTNPDANYWEPQIPMIAHMMAHQEEVDGQMKWVADVEGGECIAEGGQYVVKFDVNAPAAGTIRLDFCSWENGATKDKIFDVAEGDNYFEVEFLDYPTETFNAMIFYQCAKIPGIHKIKKVELWDLDADPTGIKTVKNKVQNNVRYNLAGQQVDSNYKGTVIMNGKKYIQK